MSQNVVIFAGVPGCGKTVLMSVLSHRYQDVFLAKNAAAQNYWELAEELEKGEWPAPNNPLAAPQTSTWELKDKEKRYPIRACDLSGEAWETFVAENQSRSLKGICDNPLVKLRNQLCPSAQEELKGIEEQFRQAACVCLLLDLSVDVNNPEKKNWKQIKFVSATINFLQKNKLKNRSLALVVTKCKTYGHQENWQGILRKNYQDMVSRDWGNNFSTIETDAVADTIANEQGDLVPAPNFSDVGVKELLQWVIEKTRKANAADKKKSGGCSLVLLVFLALLFLMFFKSGNAIQKRFTDVFITQIELSGIPEYDNILKGSGQADLRIGFRPQEKKKFSPFFEKQDCGKYESFKFVNGIKIKRDDIIEIKDADWNDWQLSDMGEIPCSKIYEHADKNENETGICEGKITAPKNNQTYSYWIHYRKK